MRVHSGNKVSFIILCDARLTVHVMQTSREVYIAWVLVQSEHQGLPSFQQVSAVGFCRLVVLKSYTINIILNLYKHAVELPVYN